MTQMIALANVIKIVVITILLNLLIRDMDDIQ